MQQASNSQAWRHHTTIGASVRVSVIPPPTARSEHIATRIDSLAQLPGAGVSGCFELALHQLLGNEEIDQLIPFLERSDVQVSVLCLNLSGGVSPQALARLLAVLDARHAALGLRSLPVRVNGREGGDIDLALQLELAKSKSALYLGRESVYALICSQVKAPWLLERVQRFASFGDGSWDPTGWNDRTLRFSQDDKLQMWKSPVLVRAVATLSHEGRIGFSQQLPAPEHLEQLEQAQAPFALDLFLDDDNAYRLILWLAEPRPQLQVLDLQLPAGYGATVAELFKSQPFLRRALVRVSGVAAIEWTAHPTLPMTNGSVSLTLFTGKPSVELQNMLGCLNPRRLVLKNAAEPLDEAQPLAKALCDGLAGQCPGALRHLTLVWDKYRHDSLDKLASLLQGLDLHGLRLEMRGGLGCDPSELTELLRACVPLLRGFEVVDVTESSSPKRLYSCLATWVKEEWEDAAAAWLGKGAKDVGEYIIKIGGFSNEDLRSMAMVQRRKFSDSGEAIRKQQTLAVVAAMRYRVSHKNRFDAVRDEQWMRRLGQTHTGLASDVYALLVNEPELKNRFF